MEKMCVKSQIATSGEHFVHIRFLVEAPGDSTRFYNKWQNFNSYLCTKGATTMITPGERWIHLEGFSPRDGYRSMGVIIRWRRGAYKILFFTIRVL
jgi:hypothetical protein